MDISMNLKCNKLVAKYCINNGALRSIETYKFKIQNPIVMQICIEENGKRIITLLSEEQTETITMYSVLLKLERLLNIFDGAFIPLIEISLYGDESIEAYNSLCVHLKKLRLKYFLSAPFFTVQTDRIVNYEDVLSEKMYERWEEVLGELGVVNQMYLYAVSDNGMTNDIKCAFLIELAEPLSEILQSEGILLKVDKNLSLRSCLRMIIKEYGTILFEKEKVFGIGKILECLVNTRVNIMHIKKNQKTPKLEGKENVLYVTKMSYLYRIVILEWIGVDKKYYINNLKKRIEDMETFDGVQNKMFERLKSSGRKGRSKKRKGARQCVQLGDESSCVNERAMPFS